MARPIAEGMPVHHEDEPFHGSTGGGGGGGGLPQRKKLELKPRSARAAERSRRRSTSAKGDPFAGATGGSPTSSSSPFGDARPREEVLKSRGVDVKAIDSRIEEKAAVTIFTKDQEHQVESIRAELSKAEALLREANEKEMPEEAFRVQVEEKRSELNELVDNFTKLNTAAGKKKERGVWATGRTTDNKSSPRAANSSSRRSHSPAHRYPSAMHGSSRGR